MDLGKADGVGSAKAYIKGVATLFYLQGIRPGGSYTGVAGRIAQKFRRYVANMTKATLSLADVLAQIAIHVCAHWYLDGDMSSAAVTSRVGYTIPLSLIGLSIWRTATDRHGWTNERRP